MRTLIVDDEPLAREALQGLLAELPGVDVVGTAANGLEAVQQIEALAPEAVFLDIEMPGLDGFEVLGSVRSMPPFVFVTAYDEYAIRAFEANAVDYLLKPIDPERVRRSVGRLRERAGQPQAAVMEQLVAQLRPAGPRRLAVRQANRIVLVGTREILQVGAEDKLVYVHTAKGKYLIDRTVTALETQLAPLGFLRVNRGDLVNLEYVREAAPWFSGSWQLKLANGAEVTVSRDRVREMKIALGL